MAQCLSQPLQIPGICQGRNLNQNRWVFNTYPICRVVVWDVVGGIHGAVLVSLHVNPETGRNP